jgi:hypothetical protein
MSRPRLLAASMVSELVQMVATDRVPADASIFSAKPSNDSDQ